MAALHVACAAEGRYLAHSAAMLHSAVTRGGTDVHVHYLHGPGEPAEPLRRLREMLARLGAGATFHEIPRERVAGLPVMDEFTAAMWYRIFLPELVPAADRVLYLDVDTLVVDSLAPLREIDLSGSYVAAVTNALMPQHAGRPGRLGLPEGQLYFNSGVLLMNLDAMRRDRCTDALREFAAGRGPELEWPDQDTLNMVLGGRRLALHPRWNYMNSMRWVFALYAFGEDEIGEAARSPAIRHFEGPTHNKPWHWAAEREDVELWEAHRRETPWARGRAAELPTRLLRRAAYAKRVAVRREDPHRLR
jgi:lipopolysaccharide biosynthesis glycosyltransferase